MPGYKLFMSFVSVSLSLNQQHTVNLSLETHFFSVWIHKIKISADSLQQFDKSHWSSNLTREKIRPGVWYKP